MGMSGEIQYNIFRRVIRSHWKAAWVRKWCAFTYKMLHIHQLRNNCHVLRFVMIQFSHNPIEFEKVYLDYALEEFPQLTKEQLILQCIWQLKSKVEDTWSNTCKQSAVTLTRYSPFTAAYSMHPFNHGAVLKPSVLCSPFAASAADLLLLVLLLPLHHPSSLSIQLHCAVTLYIYLQW